MSDKRRRFRAIRDALGKMYSEEPKGNLARHLNTLAALVSGIVGSKRTNFPAIAKEVPDGTKGVIHRTDRCDLSLFRLGLDLLDHFLDEGMPIPVAFAALEFELPLFY